MTAKSKSAPSAALEIAGAILRLPVGLVEIGDRLRPVDPVWVAALAGVIAAEGQRTPIEVCRLPGRTSYQLVSGGHRLEAARVAGLATIDAIEVSSDLMERRAREISENIWRKGLDPVDRAAFVAELYSIRKAAAGLQPYEDGRKASGAARWGKALKSDSADASDTMTLAYGWAEGVADSIGLSRKTIYRDLELHRGLAPDVVARLRGHSLSGNAGQLRALARLAPEDQRETVDLILSGAAKSVSDARATILQTPKPDPQTKAWNAFFGSWTRMSAAKRREALHELQHMGLPRGVSIVFTGGEQ